MKHNSMFSEWKGIKALNQLVNPNLWDTNMTLEWLKKEEESDAIKSFSNNFMKT